MIDQSPAGDPADATRWTAEQAQAWLEAPFFDLLYQAHTVHRTYHDPHALQISTLLSIKTGRCPEDCAYCPQSAHYTPGKQGTPIADLETVRQAVRAAKAAGATRFCIGAAWRSPPTQPQRGLEPVCDMIRCIKSEGLESCVTLGMLTAEQAQTLHAAGLDFYNHNIDTSPAFYEQVITTRTFQDRLDTLHHVQAAGIRVCCGGILGMGETPADRVAMLLVLAHLDPPPESIPINQLIAIPDTPLEDASALDPFDLIRTIALARILIPRASIRLSAGRAQMDESLQAWCFFAGANSIFYGDTLLTAPNAAPSRDQNLMAKLGMYPLPSPVSDRTLTARSGCTPGK